MLQIKIRTSISSLNKRLVKDFDLFIFTMASISINVKHVNIRFKKRSNCCWIHSRNFDSSQKMSLREGISCNQSNYSYLESRDFSRHSRHSVTSDYRHLLWRPVTMTRVFVTNWYPWVNRSCQFCQSNCIAFHRSVLIGVYSYFISICCWTLTHFDYC